jgi:two-component system, sporulation sensor kinase E
MKSGFLDKLISRLDKLDSESLQVHFLRLAQEKGLLETIFQSIQEGVIVIDGAGRIKYANKSAEHLVGFSIERAMGRPVGRFLGDTDWDSILKLDTGEWSKLVNREMEVVYPEHRFVNMYVVPLSSVKADDEGAVIIMRDVTHDREHEANLVESERVNAVKLLAAGVAHEIGNPLNALNIHLQLLAREIESDVGGQRGESKQDEESERLARAENLKELVDVARSEVGRLDLIITQFLRAIRPVTPKLVLLQIDAVLKATLTLLKREIQNRNIEVEIDCPESLPRIRVDKDQIKQAFFNIIRNAFQAMPDDGRLRISLSTSDQFMRISFLDTGVGIRREDFGRIFEPYHTTRPDGSGLGLMIVQRIVQDHGGQIEVVSKEGAGTGFTIELPLVERKIRLLKAAGKQKRRTGVTV